MFGFFFGSRAGDKSAKRGRKAPASQAQSQVDYAVVRQLGCKGCPLLSDSLNNPKMEPTGPANAPIYILGEAPGKNEDEEGRQFIGKTGQLLRQELGEAFQGRLKFRYNNCCRCRPPNNRTPTIVEQERCRNSVTADIEACKPEVVIGVGAVALRWATNETTISYWHGRMMPVKIGNHECWFYPITHPSFVQRAGDDSGWLEAFQHNLYDLANVMASGELSTPHVVTKAEMAEGIQYARGSDGLSKLMRQLTLWSKSKSVVAVDIETSCLRPYDLAVPRHGWLSAAFSDGYCTWAVPICCRGAGWSPDEQATLFEAILGFLRGPAIKVAHSLPFELEWLTSIYGHNPPWRRAGWGDTMVQAYILDERREGLSLDFLTKQRFGFRLKGISNVDRGNLASLRVDKLLSYNAYDAKYEALLYHIQKRWLGYYDLWDVYKFQLERVMTLVKTQQVGLPVDFEAVQDFSEQLGKKITNYMTRVQDSDEAKLYARRCGKPLSPMSAPQLTVLFRDILKRPEGVRESNTTGYSVDDSVLSRIDLPISSDVLSLRRYKKLKSTYIDSMGRTGGLVYPDGRLHAKFNDLFTRTGRLSSDDPNMQNFPSRQDGWVRGIVIPPKGCIIASFDYGQIEYRVLGIVADDKYIQKTLRERYDVHMDWAERVAKADPRVYRAFNKDIKKLRKEIKNTWVFPAFYGAHSDYIARMLNMNVRAARELFEEFWEEFNGVHAWQRRLVRFYKENGYVECMTGRRRRAPMSHNMLYNTPVQGTASDIVIDAMCRLSMRAEEEDEPALQPVINIHDDITLFLPKPKQDELVSEISNIMLHDSFDWVNVPLSVEVKVGDTWADMTAVGTYFSDD